MGVPLTILVVEDNPDDALLLKLAFEEAGVEASVRFVGNGKEAMEYLKGTSPLSHAGGSPLPNLLVLDLKLPRISGFEILSWLRAQPELSQITVAVLSGSSSPADIEHARTNGADLCLKKPVRFGELGQVVRQILQEAAQHRFTPLPLQNATAGSQLARA